MHEIDSIVNFENPPITELALSVQFNVLPKFSVPHFGLYHQTIKSEYPKFEVKPPLDLLFEDFTNTQNNLPTQRLLTSLDPDIRCWFINESGEKIVQLQKNRFIHNWRRVKGNEHYPRYGNIKESFSNKWESFSKFLKNEGNPDVSINQCEITYVNHIELDNSDSKTINLDCLKIWPQDNLLLGDLTSPASASIDLIYNISPQTRLYIKISPAFRQHDSKKIIVMNLTARGNPGDQNIVEWFNIGREFIVNTFTKITTEKYHKIWKKEK